MTIKELIETEYQRYRDANLAHLKPECVYLGDKEHAELMQWAFGVFGRRMPAFTFLDCEIIEVKRPTYLAFGHTQPSPCG